jgi:DNA (cytosine-5)-methyltransferase 1
VKHLDLFSGIGGFALAARNVGWQTVAFCESEPYCQAILRKHWPDALIYDDVRTLTADRLDADGAGRVDIITGGFPCQDLSTAGQRRGISGERSGLWGQYARLIGELQPRYAVMENVSNLLAGERGAWFGRLLGDLAEIGYDAEWHCIPASAIGAPHRRDRAWIIAHTQEGLRDRVLFPGPLNAEGDQEGFQRVWSMLSARRARGGPIADFGRLRAADGLSARVDEIAALGNAIVPAIAERIFRAINRVN